MIVKTSSFINWNQLKGTELAIMIANFSFEFLVFIDIWLWRVISQSEKVEDVFEIVLNDSLIYGTAMKESAKSRSKLIRRGVCGLWPNKSVTGKTFKTSRHKR